MSPDNYRIVEAINAAKSFVRPLDKASSLNQVADSLAHYI
jgi:hypothetical protein